MQDTECQIVVGWQADSVESLLRFHARHYVDEHGFDAAFESDLARQILDVAKRSRDKPNHCNIVSAMKDGSTIAALVVDGSEPEAEPGAHFRWLFVKPEFGRAGIVPRVLRRAMDFVLEHGFRNAFASTYKGKPAARVTLRELGFQLVSEEAAKTVGAKVQEEQWVWIHPNAKS